jgi:hypothetical protein
MGVGQNIENLAEELAERWTWLLVGKDWAVRFQLLQQVHEQLRDDLGNHDLYAAVSQAFIRNIIQRLSGGAVTSLAQAHIYANSADEEHRRAASEWLSENEPAGLVPHFAPR